MAVGAINKLAGTTVEITEKKYEELVRDSENLRVLKNYVRQEKVFTKNDIITLIEAMEVNNE